jgi:general secretion pathway protein G
MSLLKRRKHSGFTLIELLVVIAIISLISAVILSNIKTAQAKSRDAKRRTDLAQLRTALELYYTTVGSYPPTGGSSSWRGTCATYGSYGTTGSGGWIPNLAPTYITVLPVDPKPNGVNGCYLYTSNGTDYKLLAHQTMEAKCPTSSSDSMFDLPRASQCTIKIATPGAANW